MVAGARFGADRLEIDLRLGSEPQASPLPPVDHLKVRQDDLTGRRLVPENRVYPAPPCPTYGSQDTLSGRS